MLNSGCLHACHVTAGVWLGNCNGRDVFAGHHLWQPTRLLFVVRKRQVVRQHNVVMQSDSIRTSNDTGVRDFFLHDSAKLVIVGATPAVLLGHVIPQESVLARFQPHLARCNAVGFPLFVVGHYFIV